MITRSSAIAQTALDGARGASEREAAAGLLPLSLYVTSSYLFLLAGPSKAHRKPRRRICRLPDASQARCQESFGLLGRLTLAFFALGCCCCAACAAATKMPRKAVPARPRAAHVRPRKSDDECATFPYMGPPRVAQIPPEAAFLIVGCCARSPGLLRRRV